MLKLLFCTVIVADALFPASTVVAVITAVPDAMPVTRPSDETVATEALLLCQVTDLLLALAGRTVAVSCIVLPLYMVADAGVTVTDDGKT